VDKNFLRPYGNVFNKAGRIKMVSPVLKGLLANAGGSYATLTEKIIRQQ
jgi:hypothetical protein